MSSICSGNYGDASCSVGIPNDVNDKSLKVLKKAIQKEKIEIEKELLESKNKLKTDIDNIGENLVPCESENQKAIMEYQNQCGVKTLREISQTAVTRLEKELLKCRIQSKTIIDNLRRKLLTNEIGNQRIVMELQRQCENFKEINNHSKTENLILRQKLETAEKSNDQLMKYKQKFHVKIRNLKEQLTNQLSLINNEKQIKNDLKEKRSRQEVANLQHNSDLCQMKSKNFHYTLSTNELKKLRHDHQNMLMKNNSLISKLTQGLHDTKENKMSNNSNNQNDDILSLINQLVECSKQNQLLNDVLQKLTSENEQLRNHINALRDTNDNHCTNNPNKLEEDYKKSFKLLQTNNDDVKKLTECPSAKCRVIAQMEEKEVIYENFRREIQQKLEKYSQDKNYTDKVSDHNNEALRNALEILLADTLRKLIQTEKCDSTLPIELVQKDTLMNESFTEEHNNTHYHQSSLENVKQKDKEIEKLRNQIEEHVKEIDELKQLYVKECSQKEQSLNEKEKLEKRLDALSVQFKTLNDEFRNLINEKEKFKTTLMAINKETSTYHIHKKSLEKKIEQLENKLKTRDCQENMIAVLKADLNQCKESVLTTKEKLQSYVDSKIATSEDQLDELKKNDDEKVDELKWAKEKIFKFNNSDLRSPTQLNDGEKIMKSNLPSHGNSLVNPENSHRVSMNELTLQYKNKMQELEMIFNKILDDEKKAYSSIIEELKLKHIIEIDKWNYFAKKNAGNYHIQADN